MIVNQYQDIHCHIDSWVQSQTLLTPITDHIVSDDINWVNHWYYFPMRAYTVNSVAIERCPLGRGCRPSAHLSHIYLITVGHPFALRSTRFDFNSKRFRPDITSKLKFVFVFIIETDLQICSLSASALHLKTTERIHHLINNSIKFK